MKSSYSVKQRKYKCVLLLRKKDSSISDKLISVKILSSYNSPKITRIQKLNYSVNSFHKITKFVIGLLLELSCDFI